MGIFNGRINRVTYWLCLAAIAAVYAAKLALPQGHRASVAEWVLAAIAIPRLHDVGRSGWWVAAPLGLEIAVAIFAITMLSGDAAMEALGLVTIVILILMIVLGLIPGQRAANRFGESPRAGLPFGKRRSETDQTAQEFD